MGMVLQQPPRHVATSPSKSLSQAFDAVAKAISKKPPTKFQEFRLSHQKPKSRGRRTLIEELYKTAAAARQTLTGHKRQKKAAVEEKRAGEEMVKEEDKVARQLFAN